MPERPQTSAALGGVWSAGRWDAAVTDLHHERRREPDRLGWSLTRSVSARPGWPPPATDRDRWLAGL